MIINYLSNKYNPLLIQAIKVQKFYGSIASVFIESVSFYL